MSRSDGRDVGRFAVKMLHSLISVLFGFNIAALTMENAADRRLLIIALIGELDFLVRRRRFCTAAIKKS